jgi:heterodisulfide reductase subunit C2
MQNSANQPLRPQLFLGQRLIKAHLSVTSCFSCRKCSGGCPLSFAMDILPHHVIRLALLGQEETVLSSKTIWTCSGCQTCTTRCPNGVDIAGVMDWLKEEAIKQGKTAPEVACFHRFFLESIRTGAGRISETRILRRYLLYKMWNQPSLEELKDNINLGVKLWKRGRVRLFGPPALRGKQEINNLFSQSGF